MVGSSQGARHCTWSSSKDRQDSLARSIAISPAAFITIGSSTANVKRKAHRAHCRCFALLLHHSFITSKPVQQCSFITPFFYAGSRVTYYLWISAPDADFFRSNFDAYQRKLNYSLFHKAIIFLALYVSLFPRLRYESQVCYTKFLKSRASAMCTCSIFLFGSPDHTIKAKYIQISAKFRSE